MIQKSVISLLAASAALILPLGLSTPASAQVTDQTDQSEEDWRKSRKKRGTTDIYRDTNTNNTGFGNGIGDFERVSPVERLPSESRRHLMRERAKAIAESDDGDISDAEYVPSPEAQTDSALETEEREAWQVLTTGLEGDGPAQGSGGSGQGEPSGGPNPTAVAGQPGSGSAPQGSRGGSTASLQEIMDAIKAGRMGGGSGASDGAGQSPSAGQASGGQGQSQGQGQSEGNSDGSGDTDGQSQSPGQSEGQSQNNAQGQPGGSGSDSGNADQNGSGDAASAYPATTRAEEPLSPLEHLRRTREDRPARGTQRSASDYLGIASPSSDEEGGE